MLIDAKLAQARDPFSAAKEKLRIGPVPDWVTDCQPDYSFTAKNPKNPPLRTFLLWSVQSHAEQNVVHVRMAMRLESMQAVQHDSQWRLEFEPRNQAVTLHWLKIRRGETVIDHTQLDKIHLLQREAGLEGCVIDGFFTALLVLEDVRPGDILEWSYTTETHPRLLPDNRFAFFRLPPAVSIGKLLFTVRFNAQRQMKWKSSGSDLTPEENRENEEVLWRWSRENFLNVEPEPNVPSWHLSYPWVQVSDCPDWGVVAHAVTDAWVQNEDDAVTTHLVEEICSQEKELLPRIERALRLVQDEFRYLSVNLEHGGQIPTPFDTVARRRFGDCKDLSVLLTQIFRRLGLSAQPVLVNTAMRRSIADLLPSPNLFDHVVVEFETEGKIRWVDVTIKNQGGGPLKRVLPNFGYGLVVDSATQQLVKPPADSITPGTHRIRESILLDTTGEGSSVAIVSTMEGTEAEMLRHHFATVPIEEISQQRLQHCANRYGHARRIGELKYRDDRETNEFHVAEVFEVNGFLRPSDYPGFCDFILPPNLVNTSLVLPQTLTRRDPFALPQPCKLIHTFDIQTSGVQQLNSPRSRVESELLRFSSQIRSMPGSWSISLTLDILDDVMPANRHGEHSHRVQQVWKDATWTLRVPVGHSAAGRNRAFGSLPSPPFTARPWSQPTTPVPATTTVTTQTGAASLEQNRQLELVSLTPPKATGAQSRDAFSATSNNRPRRSKHRHKIKKPLAPWQIVLIFFVCVILFFLLLVAVGSGTSR